MTDEWPYIVRIRILGVLPRAYPAWPGSPMQSPESDLPIHWRDGGDEPSEPTQWCIEQVGMRGRQWKRMHTGALMFYYFKDQQHAALFKLTWADWQGQ